LNFLSKKGERNNPFAFRNFGSELYFRRASNRRNSAAGASTSFVVTANFFTRLPGS